MTDLALRIILNAQDASASSTINAVGSAISQLASGNVLGAVGIAAAAAGAALVGIGTQATQLAENFQSATTTLVTGAGESATAVRDSTGNIIGGIDMVRQGLLDLSVQTGTSTQQLTDGMYMIESAGFHGAAGLQILQAAAEGAKVGNADLGTVANAVTTVMHDYAGSNYTAVQATNALITTVSDGKTHMQDLSNSLSTVLPLASSLHIPFEQVAGAIATMTNAGVPAQRATQNLAFAIRAMDVESGPGSKALAAIGLSANQLHNVLTTQGLPAALQLVEDYIGKKWPLGSSEGQAALKAIMGGAAGLNVALDVSGAHMKEYKGNIDGIGASLRSGSKDVQGWAAVQQDFSFKTAQAQQALNVLMIQLGSKLLPVIGNVVGWVTQAITSFTNWEDKTHGIENAINGARATIASALDGIASALRGAATWFAQWGPLVISVAGAITLFFLPALIKAGVEAGIAGAKIAAQFVASLVKSGVEAVINGAKITASFVASVVKAGIEGWASVGKLAAFIGSMIATGTQAVINGAKVVASFVGSMVTAGAQALIAAAKIVGSFVASLITTGIRAAITGGIMLASLVPAILSVAAEALIAAAVAIPGMIVAFIGWAAAAAAAAVATIAATWPILAIGALIALVVAGIILAIQHWAQIVAWFQGIWNALPAGITGPLTAMWASITNWFTGIGNWISGAWTWIVGLFTGAWNWLTGWIGGPLKTLWDMLSGWMGQLGAMFSGAWKWISGIFTSALNWLINMVNGAIKWIVDAFNKVASAVHGTAISWNPLQNVGGGGPPGGGSMPTSAYSPSSGASGASGYSPQSLASTATPTTAAVKAGHAKTAAQIAKAADTANAQRLRLSADQTKALTTSNSAGVQKLVAQSKAAQAAGNSSTATFYAQQANQLANQQHAAAQRKAHTAQAAAHHAAVLAAQATRRAAATKRHQDIVAAAAARHKATLAAHAAKLAQSAAHHKVLVSTIQQSTNQLTTNQCASSALALPTALGVALPDYATGTGYALSAPVTQQAPAQGLGGSSGGGTIHHHYNITVNTDSKDPKEHGRKVADEVKKQLAKTLRGQSIAPRYTSGGSHR